MPEEIKPVNQPGFMAPIVPDYSGTNGTIPTSSREIDPYALMEKRLSAIGKPSTETFTELPATILPGTGRFPKIFPGEDMEEIYAQGQTWGSKMVNSLGKGLSLTGTTLLQSTVGLANGIYQSFADGRAASFYDNDFNRNLDEFNKELEDSLPNYYTKKEKNAEWYSPDKLFTANFFWDGIIKNMGFAAGAALSGYGYAAGLKALSSLPKMAKLFSVGKAAETLAATEEAILTSGKAAETYGKIKSLSDKFLGTYNSLNTGQRVLVAGLATTGEAGFEAYQNLNEFRNKKIEEYKDANGGLIPTGAELDKINSASENVGNASFLSNVALLTATNYIQFPKILASSTKLEKGILDQTVKEIGDITKDVAGKYIPTPSKYGKVFSAINKIRPYTFSASEAFEEGAQFAIGKATNDYYNKKQKGDSTSFINSLTDAIADTVGTTEGMENVLIGGLSGAIMQARGKYKEGVEKEINTQEAVKLFNESPISNFTKETRDSVSRGVVLQEEREKKLAAGDTFGSKNLEFDYIINYLTPRIKYGRMDLVQSDINEYRTLASTDKGFPQLIAEGKALEGDTPQAYLERLNNLESTAENVKSLYQSLTLRYGNRVLPDGKTPVYNQEVMNKMIYAATKVADYDNRIPQLSIELSKAGIDSNSIIEDVLDDGDEQFNIAVEKIDALKKNVTNPLNDDQIQDLQLALVDLAKSSIYRKKFIDEYNEIKKTPEQFTTQTTAEEEEKIAVTSTGESKKTVKIKTKNEEDEFEIGTEYFLGRVVEEDKDGKEVYRFPKLTILGENEDGTIKIRDNNGVRDISKDVLLGYKLGKVSAVTGNVTANYYMNHINTVYQYNFGKDSKDKVKRGRLEYEPKGNKLFFVYKNYKGEIDRKEVDNTHFVAQKNFKEPRIKIVRTLVAETAEQKKAREEFTSPEEVAKTQVTYDQKVASRRAVIKEISDDTKKRLEGVSNKITSKREQLSKITEELNELKEFRVKDKYSNVSIVTSFNKILSRSIRGLSKLTSLKNNLEQEIAELEDVKDELEFNLSYFEDFIDNIRELPESFRDMVAELKDQVKGIKDLSVATGQEINQMNGLIKSTEKAIKDFAELLKSAFQKFNKDYPDYIKDSFERMKTNPTFEDVKGLKEYVADVALMEDTKKEISINEKFINDVNESVKELYEKLNEFDKEQNAKEKILKAFEVTLAKYEQQQAEEKAMVRRESLLKRFLGTMANEVQNNIDQGKYEAASKKDDLNVVGGTVTAEQGKAHQLRSNQFGNNFHTLDNKDDVRGIIVTSETEEEAGIPGLIDHLTDKGKLADSSTVIVLVMVQDNGDGTTTLVDVDGKPIPQGIAGEELINSAIFQVFPQEKKDDKGNNRLEATYDGKKESMFRDAESEERKPIIKALTDQYVAWRNSQLAQTTLGEPQSIDASFGIPEYVTYKDEYGKDQPDYKARVAVEDAGLLRGVSLEDDRVITVATTNDTVTSDNGSVAFKTPLGRVFMKVPGGLVKLFNTKLTKSKADTIFKVIKQLATNALNEEDTAKSEPLFTWLRSTIYWGIAKDFQTNERKKAGYNNVWFEEVYEDGELITKLFISGKEEPFSVTFTPTDIEDSKGDILALLENLYHNTSATGVNKTSLNEPFFEIIDIDKNGNPVTKRWDNYQTYLLSSKGRPANEIPLTTRIKPITEGQVNRKGVYFTINSTPDNYVIPQPVPVVAPQPQAAPAAITPVPTAVTPTPAPIGTLVFDGKTPNITPILTFGNVTYKLDAKVLAEIIKREGDKFTITPAVVKELIDKGALDFEINEDVAKALAEAKNKTLEQAQSIIVTSIVNKGVPVAKEMNIPQAPPLDAPTQEEDDDWGNTQMDAKDDKAYRLQLAKEAKRFTPEDWQKVEEFIKNNLPNISFYRVKNMIQATNGRQAWGMLHNGAVYVTEMAEVGTAYHEVFEAVWKMMTSPEERNAVLNEFKERTGSYEDPFTGETIKYSEATDADIKEKLAEEFRDYVMFGTLPAKATSGKNFIQRVFAEIVNAIKAFFTGEKAQINTANLFEKIGNGYYRDYVPYESNLAYAKAGIIDIEDAEGTDKSEFRIANIPSVQVHEIMQEMTYSTLRDLVVTDASLFKVPSLNKKDLYARLKEELVSNETGLIRWKATQYAADRKAGLITPEEAALKISNLKNLQKEIINSWDDIVVKHEEYLRTYSIEFDENDNGTLNDESNTGRSDYMDARKMDAFKKANSAIKLLFATLPYTKQVNGETKINRSTIGGATLIPMDRVFITLKNKLYNAVSINDMLEKLRQLAINDPNYESLYTRIAKTKSAKEKVDYKNLKSDHNIQLLSAFWKSMKSQNPDVKTVFILPSGEIVIGDSNLSSDSKQARQEFFGDVLAKLKSGTPYIEYDSFTKTYSATDAVKNYKLNPKDLRTYTGFLEGIGIEFNSRDIEKLKDVNQRALFVEAVEGLKDSFIRYKGIAEFTKRSLNIDNRLLELGMVKSVLTNPDFESTYFNLNGEPTQTYIGTNPFSNLFDVISRTKNINDLSDTIYKYLNTDVFTKGSSVVLNAIYNSKTGKVRPEGKDLLSVGIADGLVNELLGKKKDSSKITQKERSVLEMNLNLKGWYMNLVPGDASIEWMIKLGNNITKGMMQDGYTDVFKVFKNYFIAEVNLAKEERPIVEIELTDEEKKAGKTPRKTTDLRFFKGILGEEVHADFTTEENLKKSAEQLYNENEEKINSAVKKFIETRAINTRRNLERYGIISYTEKGIEVEDLNLGENVTEESLSLDMRTMTVNYIIANIELHKIMYSDPYQYKDELKRSKSFQSPRQELMNSPEVNDTINQVKNKGYKKDDIGYTDFGRGYFKSSVIDDVFSVEDLKGYEKPYEITDGGGYISMKANRNFRERNGNWNDNEELQYRYDVAYEKVVKGLTLTPEEEKFEITRKETSEGKVYYSGKNPAVMSAYTDLKPIVTGSKDDGETFNDVVVDKFALVPLSFRILHEMNPESNAIKFYNKMQRDDVDYAVYGTGRKVGAGESTALYNNDMSFNDSPFKEINRIPFEIIGLQSEVPSKPTPSVTQGSQITKLVTLDLMEAGVPIDFEPELDINARFAKWIKLSPEEKMKSEIYKEVVNNQKLLEERMDEGFKTLLSKLGIVATEKEVLVDGVMQTKKAFVLDDVERMVETLKDEIFKREVNDNISDALAGFKKGDVVLEATPSYKQIKNILYSIADKNVISPKINGGFKVQITSALLESNLIKSEIINGKRVFKSDVLKFYKNKDGERICEVMIGRWFDNETTRKMSDDELLKYLNTTDEGKKILEGVGFRTPNQKQNSTDVFRIAKFLPKEFGDSIVVPSALVKKAGSDFDIDKLSIYLKNIYFGTDGKPRYVPFLGYGEEGKAKFREMFDKGEFISPEDLNKLKPEKARELDRVIEEERSAIIDSDAGKLLFNLMGGKFDEEIAREFVLANTSERRKEAIVNILYKKSLENAYMESMQNLISHPLNFERLTLPNSAKELQDLTKEVIELTGEQQFDYSSTSSMLDREFMSSLRHAFVSGKYAIGIAATSQTNNAQLQRFAGYVDTTKLNKLSPTERHWLKDGKIKFKEFNSINIEGKGAMATLSMVKNKAGKYISDIIGQFIDGYVDIAKGPWIMQLGASPNVASTWLFLVRVGVPIKTVAYFMNQPIIRDYLASVENAGYSWLFIEDFVNATKGEYKPVTTAVIEEIPSDTDLKEMLGAKGKLNDVQKSQQQFMLDEFLKYAKLAEHLFLVQQGSNFDTATINDPFLVFKKMLQLKRARGTIISSVDDILENSFVGRLKDVMGDIRDAMSTILISDRPSDDPTDLSVRDVMEAVLSKYIHLNDRDFTKVAQKAVNDLFDWAVQTDTDKSLNTKLKDILLGGETRESASDEIMRFVESVKADESHSLNKNYIVQSIKREPGSSKNNTPNNLYISGKSNKVYDQNQIIYAFNELKNGLGENKALYQKIVDLAVLQSGLSNSRIAFTTLLPYEDFKEIYNNALFVLDKMPNLRQFYDLNVFERNNWSDSNIIPSKRAKLVYSKKTKKPMYAMELMFIKKPIEDAVNRGDIPRVIKVPTLSREAVSDFMTYSWDTYTGKGVNKELRKKNDYSYINKGLFKKVYGSDGKPVIHETEYNGVIYTSYLYKAINAWGDGFRANEFYTEARTSEIDNGMLIVKEGTRMVRTPGTTIDTPKNFSGEVEDRVIEKLNSGVAQQAPAPVQQAPVAVSFDTLTEFAPERKQQLLSNFATKHKMTKEQAKKYINEALQKDRENTIAKLKECY